MQISVSAVVPDGILDVDKIRREIKRGLDTEGREDRRLFDGTTSTWRNRPRFDSSVSDGRNEMSVTTKPEGQYADIYNYVDKGTRPHVIRPRRASRLRFRTGYKAKTSPGSLRSGSGGASGDVVYARQVQHPGTKAREFSKQIANKRVRPFGALIAEAIERGVRKS